MADTPIVTEPRYSARSTPQVQAQLTGAYGPVKGWLGLKTQDFEPAVPATTGNLRMNAIELGAAMDYERFSCRRSTRATGSSSWASTTGRAATAGTAPPPSA